MDKSSVTGDIQSVSFTLNKYDDDLQTKTEYDSGGDIFNWSEGDAVGIVSPEGSQLKFPIRPAYYGQPSARFDGRGFALKANTEYSSYYPFIPDFELDPTAVPIAYTGQSMVGDNSMGRLGLFAYTVAKGNAPSAGILDFSFQNIGSPHRYRLPVLAGDYESLTLCVQNEEYILDGTIDLYAESESELITIHPVTMADEISLDLTGTSMATDGQLRCWMMMPPVNLEGDIIKMKLTAMDGSCFIASVQGRDCPANSRKVFNAQTSVWPAEREITSDGGTVQIKLIRSSASDAVTLSTDSTWLTQVSSSTEGLVTTYTFSVAENTSAERTGHVSFTETSTGLINSVEVKQGKAGTIIGIGGWDTDNHSGTAN
ncbi:MAG: BACON domain-containing protein [Bacteroidales bacterium]|nr:BACON domain-containing protein [Bacteroidales bacterium]